MGRNETAITLVALVAGVSGTLALFFGNFTVAYLVQALSGERVPVGRTLLVMLVAALSVTACGWAVRVWWRASRPRAAAPAEAAAVDATTPAPSPSRSDTRGFQRQLLEASRTRLLELAEANGPFSFEQGRAETGLEQIELEYLLDDLIQSRRLRTEARGAGFVYLLRESDEG